MKLKKRENRESRHWLRQQFNILGFKKNWNKLLEALYNNFACGKHLGVYKFAFSWLCEKRQKVGSLLAKLYWGWKVACSWSNLQSRHSAQDGGGVGDKMENFENIQSSCFMGVAWNVFLPKRYQSLHNTWSPVIYFRHKLLFRFNTLNGSTKSPAVDLVKVKTLRDTKTAL